MSRLTLKLLNGLFDLAAGALLLTAAVFSAYSIWDNAQIYRSALDVQDSIRQYRPVETEEDDTPDFQELRGINPDVIGWLTLEGANVDYPVLLGKDNLEYMNKDVYGDFSLAGSIFLDKRCDSGFQDRYSLIYGHNMDQHLMFGDLALYKDRDFFASHTTGQLITPAETQNYQISAVLQLSAGTEEIFNPDLWKEDIRRLPGFLRERSIWYHEQQLARMEAKPWGVQVVTLVTCSDGSTNDRTVLVLQRERPDWRSAQVQRDSPAADTVTTRQPSAGHVPKRTGDGQNPAFWYRLIGGIVAFIALFEMVDRFLRRRREEL